MSRRRRILVITSVLLLVAGMMCGSLMRRATNGAADPDTQEITTAEASATIEERIANLDAKSVTNEAVRSAIADQLSGLGARGFIRVRIMSRNIDVLVGTDYNLDQVLGNTTGENFWHYRMSLAPADAPDQLQPLYVTYANSGMGAVWGELLIGSAGPTAAQTRAMQSLMVATWTCVCLAVICFIVALVPSGSRVRRVGSSWTPVRRGVTLVLIGAVVAAPVAWILLHRARTAARAQFARGTDLVAATSASSLASPAGAGTSAAWLHAFHSMEYIDSSFRVLVDGKLRDSRGTDYGPGSYVKPGDAGEWRTLSPVTGDTAARSVYVTAATAGKIRVEMAVTEPAYWQVIRLRTIILWVTLAALAASFALGYFVRRRAEPTVLSSEEILQRAVARQAVLTVLIVCLALVPAAGWFLESYQAASLGRLDETLQRDAAGLQTTFASMEPGTVATKAVQFADQLDTAQTGLVFSLKYTTVADGTVEIRMNPQYSALSVVIGNNRPHYLLVANRTDPSVPPGKNMFVRVMTFSNRLKDGIVYTALLGTTMRPVQRDMQDLWKAAAWAGPVALLFLVLAGLIAARLALRPVTASMRRLEQFAGDAGHELRTPLSSIALNAQVALNQDEQPEEFRRHLTAIAAQADRSTRLSESLLLLARLDREEDVPLESCSLAEVWHDVSATFAEQLAAKELTLQPPTEDLTVTANRDLLTVALDNLLENAIRYSPAVGDITIAAQRAGTEVTISVADHGAGIPAEALAHIWDRFYRVDASRSRASGGNGLGLAIVRKAVEAMHGQVAVTSTVGTGSTFSIVLMDRLRPSVPPNR